jgi:hypothetical protein
MTNTREKLLEAKYFLEHMIENQAERDAFKYNLSAFLSAARSVTLVMQNEYHNVSGFDKWYNIQQDKMKADDKMKILDTKRDVTIHQESVSPRAHVDVHITEHITFTENVFVQVIRADGTVEPKSKPTSPLPPSPPQALPETESTVEWHWYFHEIPDSDVTTVCREHIIKLESIVAECERLFGSW